MDKIYKSLIYDDSLALSVLNTTALTQRAIDIHKISGKTAEIFGALLTFTAYLGSTLKSVNGCVSVSVKTATGSVSVSCDSLLHVRGCLDGDIGVLKGGTLTVISEDGYGKPFVGTCLMEGYDLSHNLAQYFRQSAQVITFVRVDCIVEDEKCLASVGIVASCLPNANGAQIEGCREKLFSLEWIAKGITDTDAESYSKENFGGKPMGTLSPVYKCNCSRSKIAQILMSVGETELRSIIAERGLVSVHCHYCNTDYNFNSEDIDKLYS